MPRWPGESDTEPTFLWGRPRKMLPTPIQRFRIWRISAPWVAGIGKTLEYLQRHHGFIQVNGLADHFYAPRGWVTNGSDYFDSKGELQFSVVQSKRFGLTIVPRARKEIP